MEHLEAISTLIVQVTGNLSSWLVIMTNFMFLPILFLISDAVKIFYDKISGMPETIINIASCMFFISLYMAIYKVISGLFKSVSKYQARKDEQEREQHAQEAMRATIRGLSLREIGIIKFMLRDEFQSAWLQPKDKAIIFLQDKGFIEQVGEEFKNLENIYDKHGSAITIGHLYRLTPKFNQAYQGILQELQAQWKRIKIPVELKQYQ